MTGYGRAAALALVLVGAIVAPAAGQANAVIGSWSGELVVPDRGTLTVVYHVEAADGGGLTGTLDSPDQGAFDIPLSSVTFEDGVLTMVADGIPGTPTFEGRLTEDGDGLTGTFTQGGSLPLELERAEGQGGQ